MSENVEHYSFRWAKRQRLFLDAAKCRARTLWCGDVEQRVENHIRRFAGVISTVTTQFESGKEGKQVLGGKYCETHLLQNILLDENDKQRKIKINCLQNKITH